MTPEQRPDVTISTRLLTRIVVLLVALWSLLAGLVLVAFQGAASGALGAGIDEDSGQRLVGAHLLVLVPVYLLIALRIEEHRDLIWLPIMAQAAVVMAVGFSILTGDTSFADGILPVAVGIIFTCLLAFIWITEQRSSVTSGLPSEGGAASTNQEEDRLREP